LRGLVQAGSHPAALPPPPPLAAYILLQDRPLYCCTDSLYRLLSHHADALTHAAPEEAPTDGAAIGSTHGPCDPLTPRLKDVIQALASVDFATPKPSPCPKPDAGSFTISTAAGSTEKSCVAPPLARHTLANTLSQQPLLHAVVFLVQMAAVSFLARKYNGYYAQRPGETDRTLQNSMEC
jgi:hypothetical protein